MEENRLALIRRWSMADACEELGIRVDEPREAREARIQVGDRVSATIPLHEPDEGAARRGLVAEPSLA